MSDRSDLDWLRPLLDYVLEAFHEESAPVEVVAGSVKDWPVTVRVGKRLIVISRDPKGFAVEQIGQGGPGRPQLVSREVVQRQYGECRDQLTELKQIVGRRVARRRLGSRMVAGAVAANATGPVGQKSRLLNRREIGAVMGRLARVLEHRRTGERRKFWLRPLGVKSRGGRDYLVFESAPVEIWASFTVGDFSPSALALRILSVFHRLKFDFLDDDFEDKDLFIRRLVYPRAPAVTTGLKRVRRTKPLN